MQKQRRKHLLRFIAFGGLVLILVTVTLRGRSEPATPFTAGQSPTPFPQCHVSEITPYDPLDLLKQAIRDGGINLTVGLDPDHKFGASFGQTSHTQDEQAIKAVQDQMIAHLTALGAKHVSALYGIMSVWASPITLLYLLMSPDVAYMHENGVGCNADFASSEVIGANRTFRYGAIGLGSTIVVLDTGVQDDHPDFQTRAGVSFLVAG